MKAAILTLALAISTPALAQVSVATGDWTNIPLVAKRGEQSFSAYNMTKIDAALSTECRKRARPSDQVELRVPFLIEFGTDGSVKQVVVKRIDCPTAESMIGTAVLDLAKVGEFRPTGENQTGWYRGEFNMLSN